VDFSCEWAALREASELASHVVPVQSSYLSIEAHADRVRVEGGTPALQVAVEVDAKIAEEGQRAVMLRPWLELMRLSELDRFRASTIGRALDISVALRGDRTTLRTIDPDFLGLAKPITSGDQFTIDEIPFVRAIKDVIFTASDREGGSAVRLRVDGASVELTALAGDRGSWSSLRLGTPEARAFTLLVPPRALEQVARVPTTEGHVAKVMYEGGRAMSVAIDTVTVRSGVLGIEFPTFERPTSAARDTRAKVARSELLARLQFAEIFAEDHSVLLELRPPDVIGVRTRSSVVGTHAARLDAQIVGADLDARLNCAHLLELARGLDDQVLIFDFSGTRALVHADGREGFLHVLSYMTASV
jgi:hypothetical protein